MKILLAVDLSEPLSMTRQALQWADRLEADLMVLHVEDPMPAADMTPAEPAFELGGVASYDMYDPALEENVEKAQEHAFHAFLTEHFERPVYAEFRRGKPARTILEDADEQEADLIMLGKRHRGRLEKLFLGSVASKVVNKTTLPTLILPIRKDEKSSA